MEHQEGGSDPQGTSRRVDRLEGALARLSEESVRTQSNLSTLAKHLDAQAEALTSIAEKLDEQRTKRPELGALATWSLVIIALGGLALYPLQQQQERLHQRLITQESLLYDMNGNRFRDADGRRLEDKFYEHLQREHKDYR